MIPVTLLIKYYLYIIMDQGLKYQRTKICICMARTIRIDINCD